MSDIGFADIDILGAVNTYALDINNEGFIAGYFQDEAGFYHGFTAVPAPPGLVLMGSGLSGLVALAWRRKKG